MTKLIFPNEYGDYALDTYTVDIVLFSTDDMGLPIDIIINGCSKEMAEEILKKYCTRICGYNYSEEYKSVYFRRLKPFYTVVV